MYCTGQGDVVAEGAGLDLESTRSAVHRLPHTEPKVLHEVPDTSGTDLGPVYERAPRITHDVGISAVHSELVRQGVDLRARVGGVCGWTGR
jgi:hypothetical protein